MIFSEKDKTLTLEYLSKNVESQYLERKGIKGDGVKPTKLANEIIGMLNADGGVLVLGIEDDGLISDLRSLGEEMLKKYRHVHFDYIQPPANVILEEKELDSGELIFIYHIDYDYERVFSRKDNDEVYLRMDDENRKLDRDQVRKLEYDKTIRKFEDEICKDFDPADLRVSVIEYYKQQLKFDGTNEELLLKRNLVLKKDGKIHYKNAAVLLFAQNPNKYIPSASVRYIRYDGDFPQTGINYNVTKDERFEECIPRNIETLKRFIYASLRDYYYLDVEKGKFEKISEYPEEAWLEGIVNALYHRSYNIQGNSIYIKHFDDRLEISNSGPLPSQVTVDNIKNERYTRNPRIARVLSEIGYVRELNEGVNRIYESMEESMLSEPEYTDQNSIVTLILRNNISDHDSSIPSDVMDIIENIWSDLNETENQILQILFKKHRITVNDLVTGTGKTPQALRPYLKKFCEEYKILSRHSDKQRDANAEYTFRKDEV